MLTVWVPQTSTSRMDGRSSQAARIFRRAPLPAAGRELVNVFRCIRYLPEQRKRLLRFLGESFSIAKPA
jgi:hypothetical protein